MNINKVLLILVIFALFLVCFSIITNAVPWYSQIEPMTVHNKDKIFNPGERMKINFERTALIGLQARVTRELVHLHEDGSEEEIYKVDKEISIDRGTKKISVWYTLPTLKLCPQMSNDVYMWRGSMVYKPFGYLQKTYFFSTEKFQIGINDGPA
jgi:hypothetical protein